MKNLAVIRSVFSRVLRLQESTPEMGQEVLLATLVFADRCFEMDWLAFAEAPEKRFLEEIDDLRRYCELEHGAFRGGFEPYYSEG